MLKHIRCNKLNLFISLNTTTYCTPTIDKQHTKGMYNKIMCTKMQELVAHKNKYVKYITTN